MGTKQEHFHFIGVGGTGMSGIAKILAELGFKISGSDLKGSEPTKRLEDLGATIYLGHNAQNVTDDVDKVVVSTAIPEDNPEVQAAKMKGIPIIQRGAMLARIMEIKKGIAVAGAHGKTTTSSMISLVLEKNFFDPTVIVGGEISDIGGNAKLGKGEYLVAEADESDGSFLKLAPFISVITNIEDDHLDYYGTVENIFKAFDEFANKINDQGFAVLCNDDENVRNLISTLKKKYFTYGISENADYRATNIEARGLHTIAQIYFKEEHLGELEIRVPGVHNIKNALAATVVAHQLGLDFSAIARALKTFKGVQRRFQIIGEVKGITIVDDYAHHPTEVAATLKAAKQTKAKKVVGIFQPHRYSRTKFLYDEFGKSFGDADKIIISEIYAAGEKPIEGVTSKLIVDSAIKALNNEVTYLATKEQIVDYLEESCQEGDLVITLGAGDVWQIGVELVKRLSKEATKSELRKSGS